MHLWPRAYKAINGKRGAFLCLHALVYIGIGVTYITTPNRTVQVFGWLPDFLTLDVLGWVWIVAAVVGVLSAFIHDPPRTDKIGYAVMTSVPLLWAGLMLISWLTGYNSTGLIAAVVYGGFAGVIMLVSSWPNPPPIDDLRMPTIPERKP